MLVVLVVHCNKSISCNSDPSFTLNQFNLKFLILGTPDVNLAADQLSHHASSIKKLDQQTVTEVGALMEEIAHKASLSPITLKTPQARQLVEVG